MNVNTGDLISVQKEEIDSLMIYFREFTPDEVNDIMATLNTGNHNKIEEMIQSDNRIGSIVYRAASIGMRAFTIVKLC